MDFLILFYRVLHPSEILSGILGLSSGIFPDWSELFFQPERFLAILNYES